MESQNNNDIDKKNTKNDNVKSNTPELIKKSQNLNKIEKRVEKIRKAIKREEAVSQIDANERQEYSKIQTSINNLIAEFSKNPKTKYIEDKLRKNIQTIILNIAKGQVIPNGDNFVEERVIKLKNILVELSNRTDIEEEYKKQNLLDYELNHFYSETDILKNIEDIKDNYYKTNKEIEKVYRNDDSRKKKSFLQDRNIVEEQRDIEFIKLYLNNNALFLNKTDNIDIINFNNDNINMNAFYKRMYFIYCLETNEQISNVNLLNRDYNDEEKERIKNIYRMVQIESMTPKKIATVINYFYNMKDDDKTVDEQKTGWNHSIKRSRTKKQTDFINKVFDLPKLNITAENIWTLPNNNILLNKEDVYTKSIDLVDFGLNFDMDKVKKIDVLNNLQSNYENSVKNGLNNSQDFWIKIGKQDLLDNSLNFEESFRRNINLSAFGEQLKSRHALDRTLLMNSVMLALQSDNFMFIFEQGLNINTTDIVHNDIITIASDYCDMIEQIYLKNNKIIKHDGTINLPELIRTIKQYGRDKNFKNTPIDNFLSKMGTTTQKKIKHFLVNMDNKPIERKGFLSTLFTKGQRSKCFKNSILNKIPFAKNKVDINTTAELFNGYNKKFERKIDDSTLCHNIMVFMLLLDVDPRISVDSNKLNKLKKDLQKVLDKRGIKFNFSEEIQKLKNQGGKIREDLTQGGIDNFKVSTYLDFLKRNGINDKKNKGTMEDIFDSIIHLSNYKGNEFRYIEKSSIICIDYDLGRGLTKNDKLEIKEKDKLSILEKQPESNDKLEIVEKHIDDDKSNNKLNIVEKQVDNNKIRNISNTYDDIQSKQDKFSKKEKPDNNVGRYV